MLKHHFAAVVLTALAGAAHGQSSVILFGLIDLNVSQYKAGPNAGGASVTRLTDGTVNGLNGSRWGVRATEDRGAGLKALVLLEAGVIADTGALGQGGRAFGRQAYLALASASAGELRLGRQYVLSDSVVGQGNPFANALVNNPTTAVTNMGRNLPYFLNAPRADNVIQYQTPSFAGFNAAAQVAPGEGTADRFHGLRLAYANGPSYVGASYEWNKPRAGGDDTNRSFSMSANHDFGAFKLLGGLQRNRNLATGSGNGAAIGVSNLVLTGASSFTVKQIDGYTLGAEVPFGVTTLGLNVTRIDYESASGAKADLGKVALTARHALSKNTFLYAGGSTSTGDLKNYISEKTVLQAGMRMAF